MGLLLPPSLFIYLFIHLVVLFLMGSVTGSMHYGNETDRLSLLEFKAKITGDPFGKLSSWNESLHFCQWMGVACGRRHQRVTELNVSHAKLTGSISPHIGNLSFLMRLGLANNSLSLNIPQEIGNLRRLKILSLVNNSITGEIPKNVSRCSNLISLQLTNNRLTGKIQQELGYLSKLRRLSISNNKMTGSLPAAIGNLSSLISFSIPFNSIGGKIPDDLGRLTNLEILAIGSNRLVGMIPSMLFNISSIWGFDIGDNQIEGILPSGLGFSLPNLEFLGVNTNSLSGSIPSSICNATNLYYLGVGKNNFTGKMPALDKLGNLQSISAYNNHLGTGEADDLNFLSPLINATCFQGLDLSYNNFGGVLPDPIANFSICLQVLIFGDNNLYGSIPRGIGNLINLGIFGIGNNHLTGNIPTDLGKLQTLNALFLDGNRFYGEIPSSFGNLSLIISLYLSKNNLRGRIPSSLSNCHMLQDLSLAKNNLSGTIPREVLVGLSSLYSLDLSHNHLTGVVPMEVGILINLEALNVSENMLTGNVPSTLGSCVKLASLILKGNNFSGVLPSTLSQLRGLEELDVSMNDFSGKIPDYLEAFPFLEKLNISFNDFDGAIPTQGIFKIAAAVSVVGNKKLCGGIPDLKLRSCQSKANGFAMKKFTHVLKLALPLSFGVVCTLVLMTYFVYLHWFTKKTRVPSLTLFGPSLPKLSYWTLLKATNGFSPANLIGMGSFGSVYKGFLDLGHDGEKLVAVKVLNLQSRGSAKSFIAECNALRSIRHRNIVNVLTACSSVDHNGEDFKALVYNFMVNGSLEEWLHPNEKEGYYACQKSGSLLNLLQRLNIAIDVASALFYLHYHCSEPIAHCDLKPSNVLLDDDMVGHVGDFGLARFLADATCTSSANQSSSVGLRGSSGYAAPEYGMGNEVSRSGDVYSFGILLLEMFTGKRPTDNLFDGSNMTLRIFVEKAMDEQVANIADPTLFHQQVEKGETSSSINKSQNQNPASIQEVQECLTSILKVGIACSKELPRDRVDIKEVVAQLDVTKKTLLGVGVHGGERAKIADHVQV